MEDIKKKARKLAEVSHFFLSRQNGQDIAPQKRSQPLSHSSQAAPHEVPTDNCSRGYHAGKAAQWPDPHQNARREKFCKTVDQSALGIIWLDADKLVRHVNSAAQQFLRVPSEEMQGQLFNFFIRNDETVQISIFRKNRRPGVGEMHMVEMEHEGETTYLLSIRDITRRLQTSEGKISFPLTLSSTHSSLPIA